MSWPDHPVATPLVSVLVVTYECEAFIDTCLDALEADRAAGRLEVIVIDNDSSDATVARVRAGHPGVAVVEMGANVGFARANNAGFARARGHFVLLLNPDTVVEPEAIGRLATAMVARAEVGVAAPRLLNPDGTDQGTARRFPTPAAAVFGRRSPLTKLFPENRYSRRFLIGLEHADDDEFEIDWVSGAALCIRREAMEHVGGLDERFFMHFEDADLCHRVKDAGWTVRCVPRSRILHAEGGCRRGWTPSQVAHFHRGAYLYWTSHHARSRWNPLRFAAAGALGTRAALVVARNAVPRPTRRDNEALA